MIKPNQRNYYPVKEKVKFKGVYYRTFVKNYCLMFIRAYYRNKDVISIEDARKVLESYENIPQIRRIRWRKNV